MFQRIFAKMAIAILGLALIDLVYLNYWVLKSDSSGKSQTVRVVETKLVDKLASPEPLETSSPIPSKEPEVQIKNVETKTIVEKQTQTIIQNAQKEIFIPIGSGSTNSGSYADLAGLSVTIDTTKYPPIESVVFEASIWLQDANGKASTRLYAKDEGAVLGSEISTSSATGSLNTSGKFLLGGAKTYKVQAKTDLTSYTAHVDNARIKITLK